MVITNRDMASKCYACPFCDYETGYCLADENERYAGDFSNKGEGKPDWCPLRKVVTCKNCARKDFRDKHNYTFYCQILDRTVIYDDFENFGCTEGVQEEKQP